ncbi:SubName: Full=Uncharacterized protein {ECO:0000313/EMBL:CCA74356.1} [Serendipita indica DSM 11827]|nr:SubName: Full=Uncharacterized protein {ECO:0000313/EMBL:CCA74356.1} [Serendipita indica DSM 11827]
MDSIFPFDRCPVDILIPVFQVVIDAEMRECETASSFTDPIRSQAAILLALVCQRWKEIIYSTPSLWADLVLDFRRDREGLSRDSERIQRRACSVPISLYLLNIHHKGSCPGKFRNSPIHDSSLCASGLKDVTALIAQVQHIRHLHLQFACIASWSGRLCHPSVFKRSQPQLAAVESFFVDLSQSTAPLQYALLRQIGMMPRLVELHVRGLEACNISYGSSSKLLPSVKRLYITSTNKDVPRHLVSCLLSHCPHLEEFNLGNLRSLYPPPQYLLALRRLQTVTASSPDWVLRLFLLKGVEAPMLKDIFFIESEVVNPTLLAEFSNLRPLVRIHQT